MPICLIAVGLRVPDWISAGFEAYAARLSNEWRLRLIEIAPAKRGKNPDIARLRQAEGERLLSAIPKGACSIALDVEGRQWNTPQLAQRLSKQLQEYRELALLIGGADGLAPAVLARCEECWSLSTLTFPHALVRVLIAEQIYRAWSILHHHPYHRV